MRITKLTPSPHVAGRWLVFLSDDTLYKVGEGEVVSLSLYEGKELSPQELTALSQAVQRSQMREKALNLLSARPMSQKELVRKLTAPKRGQRISPEEDDREEKRETAQELVEHLAQVGLVDDSEYAKRIVRHYQAKGYGVRKLREELYRRGIPRELWEEALEEQEDTQAILERLIEKKLRGNTPTPEQLKQLSGYLARRGFGWEEVSAALSRLREESMDW